MIVVKVELWSAIDGRRTELARMQIDNIGVNDTGTFGDYHVGTFAGRNEKSLHEALRKQRYLKEGKVLHHARLAQHVWNLVAKGLTTLGYGK